MNIEVRPFESAIDYARMIDYFHGASDDHLRAMGVERGRLPAREAWLDSNWRDHELPDNDPRRDRFCVAWLLDGTLVGHSSINKIHWGREAYAHLHLWTPDARNRGAGTEFFRRSVAVYFDRFQLELLIVEPYADNAAPNRVVQKLGFRFARRYRTVPGPLNFEQDVNRYEMTRTEWLQRPVFLDSEETPARFVAGERRGGAA